jgi:hypothetical protein
LLHLYGVVMVQSQHLAGVGVHAGNAACVVYAYQGIVQSQQGLPDDVSTSYLSMN